MATFTRRQLAELLETDEGFIARLEEESILVFDTTEREYSERMLERARVAISLVEELDVNLPGVAVIVRMREQLATERTRVDELVNALRQRGR